MIEIKHRLSGAAIYRSETAETVREVVEALTDLMGANLRGADLRGADLMGASLRGADLRGADLMGADLRGEDLSGANLSRADLRSADLRSANLSRADLSDADLSDADLSDADLRGANLSAVVGVVHASVGWHTHGERGRTLLGVMIGAELRLFCGCFCGTAADLRSYIAAGEERYRPSRLRALEIVEELIGGQS